MKISHDSILEALYASTALATLTPEHRATLLHPDHAPAIKALVKDAVGIVIARCPNLSPAVNFLIDSVEIELPAGSPAAAIECALRPVLASIILYIVRLSAGESPVFPSAILDSLNQLAAPAVGSGVRIRRVYY
ncbi:MAG: hypothetical protein K2M19_08875 [Muribaculaceae bacterium]|nr:hypothetical protein [Muribaculaceae bacterium]